jgi:hypothetical protein
VTIGDIVRLQARLLREAQDPSPKAGDGRFDRRHAGPGAGNPVSGTLVERVVSIGAAPLGAMGLGLNHLQRQMIQLDPAWQGGHYPPPDPSNRGEGLALARALAVCTYKSSELFEHRFAPQAGSQRRSLGSLGRSGRFDVAGYLDYQGEKFVERFDANAYLAITRTMDTVRSRSRLSIGRSRIQPHPGGGDAGGYIVGLAISCSGGRRSGREHGEGRSTLPLPGAGFVARPRRFSGGAGRAGAAGSAFSW